MVEMIFFKGIIVGLFLCAPVGPIGIWCLRRTLTFGPTAGLLSFLGASTVDGVYGAIAGMGLTYISNFLSQKQTLIQLIGGMVLILLGIRVFFSRPQETPNSNRAKGALGAFTSSFFLTLTNPMPILVFTAAFSALGVHGWKGAYISTGVLVAGVFAGSAAWGPVLVTALTLFQLRLTAREFLLINRVSGAIIMAFGLGLEILTLLGKQV